jgi:hypothetical protein
MQVRKEQITMLIMLIMLIMLYVIVQDHHQMRPKGYDPLILAYICTLQNISARGVSFHLHDICHVETPASSYFCIIDVTTD